MDGPESPERTSGLRLGQRAWSGRCCRPVTDVPLRRPMARNSRPFGPFSEIDRMGKRTGIAPGNQDWGSGLGPGLASGLGLGPGLGLGLGSGLGSGTGL